MATELPIIQCTLDTAAAREQAGRYAEVAKHVAGISRSPQALVAELDADVDGELMRELIEIERGCCSFLEITWDGARLSYAVERPDHAPALDVIAEALSG